MVGSDFTLATFKVTQSERMFPRVYCFKRERERKREGERDREREREREGEGERGAKALCRCPNKQ